MIMSITLTAAEQRQFRDALSAILAFGASGPEAWERGVCRRLKVLLRADRVGFFGTPTNPDLSFSEDYDDDVNDAYARYYSARDPGRQRMVAERRPLFTRAMLFEDGLRPLFDSECYNDFFVPNGMEDSVGLPLPGAPPDDPPPGLLALHRAKFGSEDFSHRAPALLGMLLEPFRHGFRMRQLLKRQLPELHRTVDALPMPAALFGLDGHLHHANALLLDHLAVSPDGREVQRRMEAAARGCVAASAAGAPLEAAIRPVAGPGPRATLIHSLLPDPLVLVVLPVAEGPQAPSVDEMRARFGLTRRQAEVARLLASRKTNEEVAAALGISVHTARRHTEAVLSKLGLRSRRHVARSVARPASPSPVA